MNERAIVALYHGINWKCSENISVVSDGVQIGKFNSCQFKSTYEQLCINHKVDEGEPFEYDLYALFNNKDIDEGDILFCFGFPDTIVDRYSNLLAMVIRQPISMCRLIWSDDNFKSVTSTERLYYSSEDVSHIFWDDIAAITESDISVIKNLWNNMRNLYKTQRYDSRLINVLNYYYMSWRSHTLEQLFINLSIIIELLFAPHSQAEVSHQVAFNISKYLGNNKVERYNIYKDIKHFYSIRSAIIHGGMPGHEKMMPIARSMYLLITQIIISIISSESNTVTFSDETKRNELFRSYLFD